MQASFNYTVGLHHPLPYTVYNTVISNFIMHEQTTHRVRDHVAEVIHRRIQEAAAIHPAYEALWQSILDVSLKGGKRLRPYLTFIGNGAYADAVVPVAVAQELLHIAMLIHDDIIDQDLVRHGDDNISGAYLRHYKQSVSPERARHFADSAALLAGDALISEAYQCVATSTFAPAVIKKLQQQLGQAVFEVIGGELLDVEAGFLKDGSYDPLDIYHYKTASYSFIGPLAAGALCNNASQEHIELLTRYGAAAGLAYQLQDDLLGLYGDSSKTGKSTVSDLREAKQTYLVAKHTAHATPNMQRRFEQLFGSATATDQEMAVLKHDMVASGARAATEALIAEKYEEALSTIAELPESLQKTELTLLTTKLMKREV